MRRILAGVGVALAFASAAEAKCVGTQYKMQLGTEVNIHRDSNGGRCLHRVNSSRDPIYGIDVKSKPQHGSLEILQRLSVAYTPSPGFKGDDSYSFQWVGKQGGTTPTAMTINVSVTVR